MSLSDIRLKAGMLSEKQFNQVDKFSESEPAKLETPELFSDQMTCFLFEAVIRPMDDALVIHLKHLPPALRNRKFFDFAAEYIRDRIGKFGTMDASFIGELDQVNKLNSVDLIFTKYYPAIMGDMEFIKKHTAKIGFSLNELLVRELGQYVAKT